MGFIDLTFEIDEGKKKLSYPFEFMYNKYNEEKYKEEKTFPDNFASPQR